ncbi:MAG TPA: ThiF family adenylyltransferase [Humidesulfovibrio sp.]|uniref:ThiF family adenylyltransferase n=1 Tax=Humidesulfovibrio sp. TaxID=2910988 RepID=UPI002B8E4179|nr:ThiF family adenylyltransferase [Humidesulfovibrio sp.]HWR04734.1 ThiF family adenylyltransferase [Humidesulfovibrio sp.]
MSAKPAQRQTAQKAAQEQALPQLEKRIRELALPTRLADGRELSVLSFYFVQDLARTLGRSRSTIPGRPRGQNVALVERAALKLGVLPERYLRNHDTYSLGEQLSLLSSRAALVGLGGLGGYVLELLARAGVGHIRAADGDEFVASNLNRQLYATRRSLGGYKAAAAAARLKQVNPAVDFEPVAKFLDEADMGRFISGAQLCLDALGGLKDRAALARQAAQAGIPLLTAAVAGQSGLVALVLPGQKCPSDFFGAGAGAEDSQGTPAPAVATAASIMAGEAVNILCGREPRLAGKMLVFDLAQMSFETVAL